MARAHGSFVCGNDELLWMHVFGLAILAGAVALSGRHRAATIAVWVLAYLMFLGLLYA